MNELTRIEQENVALLCKGLTAKEIAEERFVAPSTVRAQIASLKVKFEAVNTTNLIYILIRLYGFNFNEEAK